MSQITYTPAIPLDKNDQPLAWKRWRVDGNDTYWVDAWNGWYTTYQELLREIPHWTMTEQRRILHYGEDIIDEEEMHRRLVWLDSPRAQAEV